MNDRIDIFLERMCSRVKYKTVHNGLKKELLTHIEEMAEEYESFGYNHDNAYSIAVSHMGNAFETGEAFNEHYKLPFDKSFGLGIWSMLVTAAIYFAYPIIYKLHNNTLRLSYGSVVALLIILLFGIGNVMFLRRGQLKIAPRDCAQITVGFLAGWAVSVSALMLSSFVVRSGYYPYFTDVKIPFAPMYLPLLPKDQFVFGMEYFCWWFCMITYMIAAKSRKKIPAFTLVAGWFNLDDGKPMESTDLLVEGRDSYGRVVRMAWLLIIGESRNKYGDRYRDH